MASGEFRLVNGKKRARSVENKGMASGENSKKRKRSKLMPIVPDDLLVEIMLRLPDSRSVLRCAAVCKQWYSLIHSPQFSFRRRFMIEHQPSTFSILFKFSRFKRKPYHHLTPPWSSPSSVPKPYDLSFMPNSDILTTRASSGDLLLLAESKRKRRYHICNFLTKYWFPLPRVPYFQRLDNPLVRIQSLGSALVLHPNDANKRRLGRYRVVLVRMAWFEGNFYHCTVNVFSSETSLWTLSHLTFPYPCPRHRTFADMSLNVLTAANGAVYWLDGRYEDFKVMASLDPFAMEFRLIPLPARNFKGTRLPLSKERVRSGVVRGRVRVSRMLEANGRFYPRLRVWELDGRDNTWELVHNVRIEITAAVFFVLGFDPNDGDAVFVVRDREVFRYEIGRGEYVMLCKFPCSGVKLESVKKRVGRHLKVLTLVHPLWPTKLPNSKRCKRRIRRIRRRRGPTKLENAILSISNKKRRRRTV